jgi:POT family proton-dependent oligopeptide transporter
MAQSRVPRPADPRMSPITEHNTPASATPPERMPRQVGMILGNEACERFSFYGMRNILVPFLVGSTLFAYLPESERQLAAKDVFHEFVIGVYFFPLLGGYLADRYFGKYNTVFWFSLIYCLGQALLAIFPDNATGFYTGLFLIAFGSGGIKPLVASFMGDQFDQSNKRLAKLAFDAFYWLINFGSLFASLLMPIFLRDYGPRVAFGIPGLLMFVATVIFWAGRNRYVHVPPTPPNPDSFLRVVTTALKSPGDGRTGLALAIAGLALAAVAMLGWLLNAGGLSDWWTLGFVPSICTAIVCAIAFGGLGASLQLDRARGAHPDEAVDGVRSVLRILIVFGLTTPFWSLFDQKASTWVLQGYEMAMPPADAWWWPHRLVKDAAQMQALNPLLVMLLIPFNNVVLYPALRRLGYEPTALRRMTTGIAFSGLAWLAAGALQIVMDGGDAVSIAWQVLPYALLTFGEVLVSATGLEFAYSQAPASMKGVIMSFWYLAVTIGNLWVLLVNAGVRNEALIARIGESGLSVPAFQMFFFAGFALLAALAFGLYARRYREVDNYRKPGA